jgi:hypothetical protein
MDADPPPEPRPGFDDEVRMALYAFFAERERPPVPAELAEAVGASGPEVEAAFRRLADDHVVVLAPGTTSVWMANPLSAVPTRFQVEAGGRSYFGNCIWDALGAVAMFGGDGEVRTWCPDCDAPMALSVAGGSVRGEGIVHFSVPAAEWWEDIGST